MVVHQFLMRENIDKIDEFLVSHQNFPYQIFLLAMASVALATVLLIFYFSQCQFVPQQKVAYP